MTITRAITAWAIRFFSKQAYRFLVVLLSGALVMLWAVFRCFREMQQKTADGQAGFWIAVVCFTVYFTGLIWYLRRIRTGTWPQFWTMLDEQTKKYWMALDRR